MISQWREHLEWALDLPEAGWDVVVFSKDAASAARFAAEVRAQRLSSFISIESLAENWGDEVVPYLTYLVSRYESFPPLVVFLHGAPSVHALYLMDTLACVNPRFDGFYSVNGLHMSNRGVLAGPGREDDLWGLFRARANAEWAAANVSFSLPLLETADFYASAQFVVSRGAVQRRPKAFWEALLRVALNTRSGFPSVSKASWEETERKGKMIAYFMEVVWHELFGNPRRAKFLSVEDICGEPGDATAPLLSACCQSPEREAFYGMLTSPVISKSWAGETFTKRAGHGQGW